MIMCMGVSRAPCAHGDILLFQGMACLSKKKNENKTQQIGFPASITNIYIHGNFPLYGI